MQNNEASERWRVKLVHPRLPWITRPVLPADLGQELCDILLNRENALEDAHYQKVVPNRFIVEVNSENYARNIQPVEGRVLQQWQIRLSECLATANSRLGRREYVLAARIFIQVRPADDLLPHQARILFQVWQGQMQPGQPVQGTMLSKPRPDVPAYSEPPAACLEEITSGQRWSLRPGTITLGRLESCDIVVSSPQVKERRLVSGQHAFIRMQGNQIRLYDGSPSGRPSMNGTYVNNRRIQADGYDLHDSDIITLAADDPNHPRPDAPGVVSFRFHIAC